MRNRSIKCFLHPADLLHLAFCVGIFATTTFSAAAPASPLLRCQLSQGGTTQVANFAPTKDPYGVEAIEVNGRFRFKAVVIGDEHQVEYIKLYTYYQTRQQAVLLHEAKYLTPVAQPAPNATALTGMNYLYSPLLEREFQYGCALFEVAP